MIVKEGMLLCGRYQLERLVGEGGTAQVFRAFDQDRQAPVAIKLLRSDHAANPDLVRGFQGEAQALAVLDHPCIVRIYALEEAEGQAFIVMDYVAGTALRDYLAMRRGPLELREASRILRDLCGALYYAHRKGIVHQDLKPGNIILTPDNRAMLTDFGIAHALGGVSVSPMTMGTPAYMSPEQIRGDPLDAQSDIYSLGVVLYEMVTGRRPFTGDEAGLTETELADRLHEAHLSLPAPDPRSFNPKLPVEATSILAHALAKRPRDRWPDVLSLRLAWDAMLGEQTAAVETVPEPRRPEPAGAAPAARKVGWIGLLALGLVVAVVALGFLATRLQQAGAEDAPPPPPAVSGSTAAAPAAPAAASPVSTAGETRGGGVTISGAATLAPTATARPAEAPPTAGVVNAASRPAASPTLFPTATTAPSATVVPTVTTAPTRPPATVVPATAVPARPSGGVSLISPAANVALQGRVTFEWRPAGYALGQGEQYELVFWAPGQDGLQAGRSPLGASTQTNATVDVSSAGAQLGLPAGQLLWGVRLWGPNGAVRMLSDGRSFSVAQSGGGGGGGGECTGPGCK